jgi:hypothetical protein
MASDDLHARAVAAVESRLAASPAVALLTDGDCCTVTAGKGRAWAGEQFGLVQRDVTVAMTARTRDELDALAAAVTEAAVGVYSVGSGGVHCANKNDTGPATGDDESGWARTDVLGVLVTAPRQRKAGDLLARARAARRAADKAGE